MPIYGKDIYDEKPFKAKLQDGVWIVEGTVHTTFGGAAYIKINEKDGKILMVTHYK